MRRIYWNRCLWAVVLLLICGIVPARLASAHTENVPSSPSSCTWNLATHKFTCTASIPGANPNYSGLPVSVPQFPNSLCSACTLTSIKITVQAVVTSSVIAENLSVSSASTFTPQVNGSVTLHTPSDANPPSLDITKPFLMNFGTAGVAIYDGTQDFSGPDSNNFGNQNFSGSASNFVDPGDFDTYYVGSGTVGFTGDCTAGLNLNQTGGSTGAAQFATTCAMNITVVYSYTGTPSAVTLAQFTAQSDTSSVIKLNWNTVSEVDNLGFNVWRSTQHDDSGFEKINATLIPAQSVGSTNGGNYEYLDRSSRLGLTYYYRVEMVATDGMSAWSHTVSSALPTCASTRGTRPQWLHCGWFTVQ